MLSNEEKNIIIDFLTEKLTPMLNLYTGQLLYQVQHHQMINHKNKQK